MARTQPFCRTRAVLLGACIVLLPQLASAGPQELLDADRVVIVSDDISNTATSVSHSSGIAPSDETSDGGSAPGDGADASDGGGDAGFEAISDPGGDVEAKPADEKGKKDKGKKDKDKN